MKAEIINIGDELLIGQVVNTNASWMASQLNKAGISVVQTTTIADDDRAIRNTLNQAFNRAEVVLISGGLGPTKDDITKKTLAEYFDSKLVFHEPTFEQVKKIFAARRFPVSEVNRQQAMIPEKCKPLFNKNGTAPGMWFERKGKVAVSMPGVPFEMKAMMEEQVIPALVRCFKMETIVHKTVMTTGMPESLLAEQIKEWENDLPSYIKLAYLPRPGIVRLRLSGRGEDHQKLETEIQGQVEKLKTLIPEIIFGYDDVSLEEVIGQLLLKKKKTISTAESCTGGYIAHLITGIPGSSGYFEGSVVSYSNRIKMELLGVSPKMLEKQGAVSREVVIEMAEGARKKLKTDYCLAVSGVAGPTGGTEEKPVGTVWIALADTGDTEAQLFYFGEHRGRNILRSALAALNMLRLRLEKTVNDK